MPIAEIVGAETGEWQPSAPHGVDREQLGRESHWWSVTNRGIEVVGEDAPRRTPGEPITLRRIVRDYGVTVRRAGGEFFRGIGLDPWSVDALIYAVIATESRGWLPADRYEAHIRDWSFGLMQTITSTAVRIPGNFPGRPLIAVPNLPGPIDRADKHAPAVKAWKEYLDDPKNSIRLGVAYLASINARYDLKGDPVLIYASYNAGGPWLSPKSAWGLRHYDPDGRGPRLGAIDHFVAWYGDACEVIR